MDKILGFLIGLLAVAAATGLFLRNSSDICDPLGDTKQHYFELLSCSSDDSCPMNEQEWKLLKQYQVTLGNCWMERP